MQPQKVSHQQLPPQKKACQKPNPEPTTCVVVARRTLNVKEKHNSSTRTKGKGMKAVGCSSEGVLHCMTTCGEVHSER
jgi:hypothetical protein